ncbi:MAG: IclR family transcriptional regulator [Pseudorhodoplanes sp.]
MSTIRNAAAVLRLLSPERLELSVTEVARLLNMPKSSVSRLLKAMMEEGLLAPIGNSPRYRAGNLLIEVASLHGRNSTLMEAAETALADICKTTRHSGYISVLDGIDILVLRVFRGAEPLRVVTPLGSRAPAYATSTGRALLARLTDDEIRRLYSSPGDFRVHAENAPQSIDELLTRLARVRRTGWCEAIDEAVPDVGSVSVAVNDPLTETLALCVSFPAHLVSKTDRLEIADMLTRTARQIQAGDREHEAVERRQRAIAR